MVGNLLPGGGESASDPAPQHLGRVGLATPCPTVRSCKCDERRRSAPAKGHASQTGGYTLNIQDTATKLAPYVLSLLRIVAALIFIEHGTSKLFSWPQAVPTPALFAMYWFAGWIEIIGGTLVLIGLFTRCAALILSGEMAFAYFISHAPNSFFPILNRGDAPILFCFVFLYIAFAGGGPLSVDAILGRKRA